MSKTVLMAALLLSAGMVAGVPAHAQDAGRVFVIEAKDGKFVPADTVVPAGQKVQLTIKNSDSAQVEFESYPLHREQKIQPGDETTVFVGPLQPGSYPFFDDNNEDAKGTLTAK